MHDLSQLVDKCRITADEYFADLMDWYDGNAAAQPFGDGNNDDQFLLGADAIWLF